MDLEDIAAAVGKILENKDAITKIRELLGEDTDDSVESHTENLNIDIGELLNNVNRFRTSEDNSSIELIHALMPFLSEGKRKTASEAEKLLRIINMIPIFKEMGIFDRIFGGDSVGKA